MPTIEFLAQIKHLTEENQKLKSAVSEKDATIAALQERVKELDVENARLELRTEQAIQLYMMHKNKTQVQLRKEIAHLTVRIRELDTLLKDTALIADERLDDIVERNIRIKELEGALEEIKNATFNAKLNGYYATALIQSIFDIAKKALTWETQKGERCQCINLSERD